jgi:hypothetical protein
VRSPRELIDLRQKTVNELNEKRYRLRRERWDRAGSGWGSWNIGGQSPFFFDGPPESWRDTVEFVRYTEKVFLERADVIYNLEREHRAEKEKQLWWSRAVQSISPVYHLRRTFTALSATDYGTHSRFMEKARKYRSQFLASFRSRGYFDDNAIGLFSRRTMSEVLDPNGWEQRSAYHRQRLENGDDIWDVVGEKNWDPLPLDLVPTFSNGVEKPDFPTGITYTSILITMVIILFAAGFVSFIHYDVR